MVGGYSIQDNSGLPKDLPASLWQAESAENPAGVPMPDIRPREFITLLGGPPGTASPPVEPQAEQRPLERTLHDLQSHRRVCLAQGGELARSDARSVSARPCDTRLSASRKRLLRASAC